MLFVPRGEAWNSLLVREPKKKKDPKTGVERMTKGAKFLALTDGNFDTREAMIDGRRVFIKPSIELAKEGAN